LIGPAARRDPEEPAGSDAGERTPDSGAAAAAKAKKRQLFKAKMALEVARERVSGDPSPELQDLFEAAERAYKHLRCPARAPGDR
jgi:hypothetical protein